MAMSCGNGKCLMVTGLVAGLAIGVGATAWVTSSSAIAGQPEVTLETPKLTLDTPAGQPELKDMPDPNEMMEMIARNGTPNEHHDAIAKLAGSWTTTGWFVMGPDTPKTTMTGTSNHEMVLGGRFLSMHFKSDEPFMGNLFEGMGVMGYDNVKGEFVSAWIDTMGTGITSQHGAPNDEGTFVVEGTMDYGMGMISHMKNVTRIVDDNTHVLEFYEIGPDGEAFQTGEITYIRN